MNTKRTLTLVAVLLGTSVAGAEDAASETYLLRYKFAEGEQVHWKVVHLGTTETTIQGNTQTSKSRSTSTKVWKVQNVDESGNVTFVHTVDSVDMWQQLSDRPEIRYNSDKKQKVPPEYEHVAKTVGVALATVKISTKGDIIKRDTPTPNANFGVGGIVTLLPEKPVKIGSTWYEPSELRHGLPDGRVKRVKIRKFYELVKVQTGVATISVKTEVLTPVNDARIQSQLVQQLTAGTIKFDLDAGRILSKQLDWDETVVGFNGADSLMKYLARFTEELLPAEARAAERIEKASTEKAQDATAAKTARASPDARPAVRRE
jgi:hypothetical protein